MRSVCIQTDRMFGLTRISNFTHYDAKLLQGQADHLIGRVPVADRKCLGLIRGVRGQERISVLRQRIVEALRSAAGFKLTTAKVFSPFP